MAGVNEMGGSPVPTLLWRSALLALAYFGLGKLGLTLAVTHANVTLIWPPSGLAVAALVLGGWRLWPGVFAGALAINAAVGGLSLPAVLAIAVGNTLEVLVGAWVVRRWGGGAQAVESVRGVLVLAFLCAVAAAPIAATVGSTALRLSGALADGGAWWAVWLDWLLGDALGIAVVTPLLLAWRTGVRTHMAALGLALAVALAALPAFGGLSLLDPQRYPLLFLPLPLVVWAALRGGPRGASAAVLLLALVAILGNVAGHGPFVSSVRHETLVSLYGFLTANAVIALLISAVIAERERAAQALRIGEERLAAAQAIAHLGDWEWDIVSGALTWSDEIYRIFGQLPQSFPATYAAFLETVHPDDRAALEEAVRRAVEEGAPYEIEHRLIRPDGGQRTVHERGLVYRDAGGRPLRMLGTVQDVSERHRAHERLEASEQRLRRILEVAPLPLGIANLTDGRITYLNPRFVELFGYSREEVHDLQSWYLRAYPDPEYRREVVAAWESRVRTAGGTDAPPVPLEVRITCRDGGQRDVVVVSASFGDEVVVIFNDVTERKATEEALLVAMRGAEAANRAKSEFLAMMSHEIRTPMNAIIGMGELLEETELSVEQRKYVQISQHAGGALLELISDVLDLSRIEAGEFSLDVAPFEVEELVGAAAEVFLSAAREKGLSFSTEVAPGVPVMVEGDQRRLRQILLNLLSNAVKFTDRGGIAMAVAPLPEAPPGTLLFSVRDSGIGIAARQRERVFNAFTQADSSVTRRYGGSGLGLAISRRLLEMMDGNIWVESEEGVGSAFFFTVPLAVVASVPEELQPTPLTDTRILLVDDNATNRLIYTELLGDAGAVVTAVDGARQAEEVVAGARVAGGIDWDLVLLDFHMPEEDGFALLARLRAIPEMATMPYLMLSSDQSPHAATRGRELGVTYLLKPLKRRELLAAVGALLAPVELPADRGEPRVGPALHILLAEDSPDNALLVQSYLKRTPHRLDVVENGREALKALEAAGSDGYDLVLMDMQMPVMDGYHATQAIRLREEEEGHERLPILALTAHALKGDEERSIASGCDGHLTKPIHKRTLLEAIDAYTPRPGVG